MEFLQFVQVSAARSLVEWPVQVHRPVRYDIPRDIPDALMNMIHSL
jgi:hypothetical protein